MDLNFIFSLETTNQIINGLADGPYKIVAPIIAEIQRQAGPQVAAAQASSDANTSLRVVEKKPP